MHPDELTNLGYAVEGKKFVDTTYLTTVKPANISTDER